MSAPVAAARPYDASNSVPTSTLTVTGAMGDDAVTRRAVVNSTR